MMKKFNIVITKIDTDTNEKEELANEMLNSIALLGECEDDSCTEMLMGLTLLDLSAMVASAKEFHKAAKIATVMRELKEKEAPKFEDDIISNILRGMH